MKIPKCFPGELVFSRIIRHFIQSGMTSTDYLEWIFGTRKVSIHPVLTCDLETISQFTKEDVETLLFQQTTAPLFLTFMSSQTADLKRLMASGDSSKALRICHYHKFSHGTGLSLEYCSLCAREDIQNQGVAYWHREHQIPGVNACSVHGTLLNIEPIAERQRLNESLLPVFSKNVKYASEKEVEFAIFSKDILTYFSDSNKSLELSIYKSELAVQGYISNHGRVRRKKLMNDFFVYSKQFPKIDPIYFPKNEKDYKYFSFLLSGIGNQHPFKYLSLGFWLFRKLDKLLTVRKVKPRKKGIKISKLHKEIRVRKKIQTSGKEIKITESVKQQIFIMAKRGFHRAAIAKRFDISAGSVEHEISQHPGMVEHRKRCKFESRRRRYRLQIIRFRQSQPQALRKDIRKAHDAAYIWLYHYDHQWLEQVLPKATRPKPKGRVDWELRDRELVDKVRRLMEQHQGRLTRTKLDNLLGGRGWMIKQQKKLPRTMRVYNDLKK